MTPRLSIIAASLRAATGGGGGGDPYSEALSLLMHFEGVNGSTTFTDEKGNTVTPSGNSNISTAQAKFGSSAGYFDGTGDYLTVPASDAFDFGTGDFTVELFVRINAYPSGYPAIISVCAQTEAYAGVKFQIDAFGNVFLFVKDSVNNNLVANSFSAQALNTWHHLALIRLSGVFAFFVNGDRVGRYDTTLTSPVKGGYPTYIGSGGPSTTGVNCYIDEVRVVKGMAMYPDAATITVPTAPFDNPVAPP